VNGKVVFQQMLYEGIRGERRRWDVKTHQVLIIEDDRDTAGFFKTVLELVGFECEIILTAKEALDRLAVSAPDLILLDIRLGIEISGEDILYQIRSNPRFDNTRVVLTTAYPHLAEPITDLADLVLIKPVEIEQLKSLMQRLGKIDYKTKLQHHRDPVTELFTEEFLLTRLELAFERAKRRPDFHFAVIAIEFRLDSLQEVQIKPGDILAILREIAARLKKFVRPIDAVARISGWKFATLHEDLKESGDIQFIVKRLSEKLSRPYETESGPYEVKFSLEAVVQDPHYRHPVDILKAAQKKLGEARSVDKS
jgi:diguanylate cyclase (GGDEF)-like protein